MAFMELSNSTMSSDLLIHRRPIPYPDTLNAGSQSSIKIPLHSASSSLNRPLSSSFRILAKFGQPINRQNYLRKKLTQLQQVSDIWDFSKSHHENANSEVKSNAGKKSGDKLESKSTGYSVLSNNLKVCVEKFKDPEFWAKVAKPTFTVFHNGKVKRVVLNGTRGSGVYSVFAREIEKGEVVNLISSIKDLSIIHNPKMAAVSSIKIGGIEMVAEIILVSSIHLVLWAAIEGIKIVLLSIIFVSLAATVGAKILGCIGIVSILWAIEILINLMPVVLCFWVIKKLFDLWSNYRQGKSVMRRYKKILSRIEEIRMRGRVESDFESPSSLDKEDELTIEDTLPPMHTDDKIQEIKEMARGVGELENTVVLAEKGGGEYDHISKEVRKGRVSIEKPTLLCKASDSQGDDVYWLMI